MVRVTILILTGRVMTTELTGWSWTPHDNLQTLDTTVSQGAITTPGPSSANSHVTTEATSTIHTTASLTTTNHPEAGNRTTGTSRLSSEAFANTMNSTSVTTARAVNDSASSTSINSSLPLPTTNPGSNTSEASSKGNF